MASKHVEALCTGIDTFNGGSFTNNDLRKLGLSQTGINIVPLLMTKGYLIIVSPQGTVPYSYQRTPPPEGETLKPMEEFYREGAFEGIFTAYNNKSRNGSRPRTPVANTAPPPPEEPKERYFEIDLFEVMEQLDDEEMSKLISGFIKLKLGQIKPLHDRIIYLEEQLRGGAAERTAFIDTHNAKLVALQNELRTAKETIMDLNNKIFFAEEAKVRPEQSIRTLILDRPNVPQRDSGGSNGRPAGHVVHGKPHTEHVPRAVVEYKNKKY